MLSAPPLPAPGNYFLPLILPLETRLANPRRLQVNFHPPPPARLGARVGVPARAGEGPVAPTAGTRCLPPPHQHTQTLSTSRFTAGSGSRGAGLRRIPRRAHGAHTDPPAARQRRLPHSTQPRRAEQPGRAREEAARAEGSPALEADPQAASRRRLQPRPPHRAPPWGHLP
ncbi:unnamed protein product [Rangifer tarandus platyrhynchus]|uniref:Uncharacterized protein n=2 Tax=Rangifer tarandus platyrhynchus TaxID=3082113 RepID=A0ACB0E3W4_RANTA|nr:unnamed protein product [Rangifer tarandus platyrhynchus]CAI9695305.1 unnamed protein product [Rangifer tarandus platyrhynchus]